MLSTYSAVEDNVDGNSYMIVDGLVPPMDPSNESKDEED